MNIEMAYMLGMILGNGEIQQNATETTVTIDIPYKNLYTDDLKDVAVYVKASIVDIRSIVEPLIGHALNITEAPHSTKMSFTKPNEEYVVRDLNKALIRYLENRFVEIARQCNRYEVLTKNTYKNTVLKESQVASMEEFVDNVRILINALGYKVLDAYTNAIPKENPVGDTEKKEDIKLYLERVIKNVGKIEAQGTITSEGFIVLKGSQISPVDDNTVPDTIKEQRCTSNIIDGILQEDMLFSSPSGAAMFVVGKSDNGLTRWKDENGRTLKEIENHEMINEK